MTCEIHAREKIDRLLAAAGWLVQDVKDTNIFAGKGGKAYPQGRDLFRLGTGPEYGPALRHEPDAARHWQ